MTYIDGHKKSGLKVGDTVRVVRKAKGLIWLDSMADSVGKCLKVIKKDRVGVQLGNGFWYMLKSVEKVTPKKRKGKKLQPTITRRGIAKAPRSGGRDRKGWRMKITTELIMSWRPCSDYPAERVRKLVGAGKTPLQVCDAKKIPVEDRLWVLLHKKVIAERDLHLLACQFAEDALLAERKAGREPDERSWNAIAVKRLWLDGKATDQELGAAWAVAWTAARAAAGAAARDAARDAAWDAAWDAARKKQLAHVRKVLIEKGGGGRK